jgi:hypothetical protein
MIQIGQQWISIRHSYKTKNKSEQITDRERIIQLLRNSYISLEVPLVVNRNIGKLIWSHPMKMEEGTYL